MKSVKKLKISTFNLLIITLFIVISISEINSQVVCSLDELVKEIFEDLLDNGKLDCLRESSVSPELEESDEQYKKRINANWDGDCSFEAEGNLQASWQQKLKENYNLKKGLVDVNGNPVKEDFDDQADMCEIIRALVANGKFVEIGEDVRSISLTLIDYITCPGGDYQTQVCAVTGGSFAEKSGWYIPLDGQSIKINEEPNYVLDLKPQ